MILSFILRIAFCAQVYGTPAEDFLNAHNEFRMIIRDGLNPTQPQAEYLPDMTWDDELARNAQSYADQCSLQLSEIPSRKVERFPYVGENVVISSSTNAHILIKSIYDDYVKYNYTTHYCNGNCKSYLQIVWAESVNLGCGIKDCRGIKFAVCRYGPGGSIAGQRPYREKGGMVTEDPRQVNLATEMLDAHNKFRRSYLNGEENRQPQAQIMPDLEWDDEIAANAQRHVEGCSFKHSTEDDRKVDRFYVGENLATSPFFDTPNDWPVIAWYEREIDFYTYETNQCTKVCGHYTAIIWASTKYVGCGRKYCLHPENPTSGTYMYICQYGPAGNIVGMKPYLEATQIQTEMVKAHNNYRQRVLNGTETRIPVPLDMPNLRWDDILAKKAKVHADKCVNQHSTAEERADSRYSLVGENIQFSQYNVTNQEVVDLWYNQITSYNYRKNTCSGDCDEFKQIIWASTVVFGCARAYCPTNGNTGSYLIVCQYGPGGNEPGKKPYAEKNPIIPPTNIAAISTWPAEITFTWTTSIPSAQNYSIIRNGNRIASGLTTNRYTLTNLSNCSNYTIIVVAVYQNGDSVESAPTVLRTPSPRPMSVKSVVLKAISSTQVTVTINDVDRPRCAKITYYIIVNNVKYTTTSKTYQISGLSPVTRYSAEVKAYDSILNVESSGIKSNSVVTLR